MKKLRKNKSGGLMVPISEIGAAHKTKRKPSDNLAIGLRLGTGQLYLWPDYWQYSGEQIKHTIPFSQWYKSWVGGK